MRLTAATPRRFWLILLAILLAATALRLVVRAQYVSSNPFAERPAADAMVYWEWAGRIADGQLLDDEPFFSAPLYPYLLGLIRALGGGLRAVYTLQIVLDLVTALLLAEIGRRRYGPAIGLLAAGLFLLLLEPMSLSLRVLGSTIQLPILCLTWLALLAAWERPTVWRSVLSGIGLGLFALTFPPAMVLMPLLAVGWWWCGGRNRLMTGRAAALLLGGVATIAPATLHNYHACGEFIPISAQAGLTFAHGNNPNALGYYAALPDVSGRRDEQNADAWRVYERETGRTPTWNDVNRYFFRRGVDYWRSNPRAAVGLFFRKTWWFLTGRHSSEIYWPTLERDEGLLGTLWLTPLPTAWLIPPALLALASWLRRIKSYLPELAFFTVPLLVCVVFWYSPRYRFPAVPLIVLGGAWTLAQLARWHTHRRAALFAAAAAVVGIGLTLVNQIVGFDRIDDERRGVFWCQVGDAWRHTERYPQAAEAYRLGLALHEANAGGAANMSVVLRKLNRPAEAIEYLRLAVRHDPGHSTMRIDLANMLQAAGDLRGALEQYATAAELLANRAQFPAAIETLRRARALAPGDPRLSNALAWLLATSPGLPDTERTEAVSLAQSARAALGRDDPAILDTLAAAFAANGRFDEAVAAAQRAVMLAQEAGEIDTAERYRARLALYRAGRPYRAAPAGN